jgi:cobalamin biosynthesis Mg chelatase CobN
MATDLRARLHDALVSVWRQRSADQVVASVEDHCRAMTDAVMTLVRPEDVVKAEAHAELRAAIVAAIRHEAHTRYRGVPNPALSTNTAVRLAQRAMPRTTQTSPHSSGATTPTARPGPTTKRTRAGTATDAPERN